MPATSCVNRTEGPTDWHAIDWKAANRQVRRLRQRIFRATQEQDWDKVQSLQRLMLRSRANALVSVRRVTQTNQGKKTPGVDKLVVKTPAARGKLVAAVRQYQPWRAKPTRRVYIPKANGKKRPLGIPTIADRALQAMVKNALEPSWEAQFEAISYGFRPGRGAHDAIAKIFILASPHRTKKWILDADITGAFDNISHEHLLATIGTFPARELIRQWLKAGYMEEGRTYPTAAGTPQGGVISPLLANIALHGMEEALGVSDNKRGDMRSKRAVVRYADDFVVFCESREDAEAAQGELAAWLTMRGLTLSEEKTRIVHLTDGFDFLGFNVRQYADKRTRTGYKLLIKPSKPAVQAIRKRLRDEWKHLETAPLATVIRRLNPIVRGWANYFRIGVASQTFRTLDFWMYRREVRHVKKKHPNKSQKWVQARYWGQLNENRSDSWVFGNTQKAQAYLLKFAWFNIERHVLVKGRASPDNPMLQAYWWARNKGTTADLTRREIKIAKGQNNMCPVCGESLFNGEERETHHRAMRDQRGPENQDDCLLVHLYCHVQIHSEKQTRLDAKGRPLLL